MRYGALLARVQKGNGHSGLTLDLQRVSQRSESGQTGKSRAWMRKNYLLGKEQRFSGSKGLIGTVQQTCSRPWYSADGARYDRRPHLRSSHPPKNAKKMYDEIR